MGSDGLEVGRRGVGWQWTDVGGLVMWLGILGLGVGIGGCCRGD